MIIKHLYDSIYLLQGWCFKVSQDINYTSIKNKQTKKTQRSVNLILKSNDFIITPKQNKISRNKPTKKQKTCTQKTIRCWWKKSKMTQTDEEIYHILILGEKILWKSLHYPKQSTDSIQYLSNYQWHFSHNKDKFFYNLYGKTNYS